MLGQRLGSSNVEHDGRIRIRLTIRLKQVLREGDTQVSRAQVRGVQDEKLLLQIVIHYLIMATNV